MHCVIKTHLARWLKRLKFGFFFREVPISELDRDMNYTTRDYLGFLYSFP